MDLIQFINDHGEALQQGDVAVIGKDQASLSDALRGGMPVIGAELAERANDTGVCGIVYDLYTEHKPEITEEPASAAAKKKPTSSAAPKSRGKSADTGTQAYTLEELATVDRAVVGPGQKGHLVAHGICPQCKVDADIASIRIGDLLTTSPTKGHAQKVLDPAQAVGAILGKALGSLKKGKGTIPVLVALQ